MEEYSPCQQEENRGDPVKDGRAKQYWFDPTGREDDLEWKLRFGTLSFWFDDFLHHHSASVAKSPARYRALFEYWDRVCPYYVQSVALSYGDMFDWLLNK